MTGVRNKLKVPGDMKSIESSRVIELIKSTRGIRYNVVSATKGVRQKYIQCISGLVVYRQYIYNCSSQVDSHLAHIGESSIRSSASGFGSALLACLRYSSPLLRLGSDPQIRNWLTSGESILPSSLADCCP